MATGPEWMAPGPGGGTAKAAAWGLQAWAPKASVLVASDILFQCTLLSFTHSLCRAWAPTHGAFSGPSPSLTSLLGPAHTNCKLAASLHWPCPVPPSHGVPLLVKMSPFAICNRERNQFLDIAAARNPPNPLMALGLPSPPHLLNRENADAGGGWVLTGREFL